MRKLMISSALTAMVALVATLTYCLPVYADGPGNFRQALDLAVHLSHRTDYCSLQRVVTPYTSDIVGYVVSISHDIPETVSPGETVNATIEYTLDPHGGCPVMYDTVYADWAPDDALVQISYTMCSSTTKSMSVSFEAPLVPGRYRIRWLQIAAFFPVHSFFGGTDGTGGPSEGDYTATPADWMEVAVDVVR